MKFLDFELFFFLTFFAFFEGKNKFFRSLECIFVVFLGQKIFENEYIFFATPLT